jgi:hypothetical protein
VGAKLRKACWESGVRPRQRASGERRALALAESGAPAFWSALERTASRLGASGTTVVVPRERAPALGREAFSAGVEILVEPVDRGTGVRLLLAVAGASRPRRRVSILVSAATTAWRPDDRLLELLGLGFHAVERRARQLVLIAGAERPLERWFLLGSEAALAGLYESTYPCLLRRARFICGLHGEERVAGLAAMYRELATLDLVDDVLRGAEHLSVLGLDSRAGRPQGPSSACAS